MNYQIGDKVPAFIGANGSIGVLIMKFGSMEKMLNMMDHSEEWIRVITE